jgi:hypothetical protein
MEGIPARGVRAVYLLCVIIASVRESRIGRMPAELASVFGRRSV